jgi:hypothetical protein
MKITRKNLGSARALGGGPPTDSAYQQVSCADYVLHKGAGVDGSLYHVYKFTVGFNNGFSLTEWVRDPYDSSGDLLPDVTESKAGGCVGATKSILYSMEYTDEDIESGGDDEEVDVGQWITSAGRRGHVKLTPGRKPTDREKKAKAAGGRLPRECYASIDWLSAKAWAYGKQSETAASAAPSAPDNGVAPVRERRSGGLPTPV